jgi:hypothetical protein
MSRKRSRKAAALSPLRVRLIEAAEAPDDALDRGGSWIGSGAAARRRSFARGATEHNAAQSLLN